MRHYEGCLLMSKLYKVTCVHGVKKSAEVLSKGFVSMVKTSILFKPTRYWSFRLETRESKIFSTIYSNSPSTKTGAGGSIDGTTGATYLRNNDLWNTLWMEKEAGRVKRKDTGLRTSEILYGPMK
ncbi:unnamed protein product [Ranitomeya imitator]|uniref:Uncharacterized protein n=1 Tax=Ranitomeya imitator TaxID=111125 RepID=A0ABN9MBS4_9NEOB|nr:unnamed protein product [Ranitomeya imitator]